MQHPGLEYSAGNLTGGWHAACMSYRISDTEEQVHQSNAGGGKDWCSDVDLATNNRHSSGNSKTDTAWSSDETTYTGLPSRETASLNETRIVSSKHRRILDKDDDVRTEQLFVQLPLPFQRTPVDQLRPGSSSERVFGELLHECKYSVPITFEAMLEDM
ncbi:uncharacterized protein LOC142767887 [Rhipicephalus microplus]|uniref:uncharacterized protein LOC142767887 n=1 Tax=Rhipicephalus microplus TaxID=6941 RepID=UPI003F6D2759